MVALGIPHGLNFDAGDAGSEKRPERSSSADYDAAFSRWRDGKNRVIPTINAGKI